MNKPQCILSQRVTGFSVIIPFIIRAISENELVRCGCAIRRMLFVLFASGIFVSWHVRPLLAADQVRSEQAHEHQLLETQITHHNSPHCNREYVDMVASQTYRNESRILDEDRDPTDVVLRRSIALFNHIRSMAAVAGMTDQAVEAGKQARPMGGVLEMYGQDLTRLRKKCELTNVEDRKARKSLYFELAMLRRQIAFANPLLNFDEIVFLKKHRARYDHIVDQYFGVNAVTGGGVFVLRNPLSDSPEVVNLLKDTIVTNGRFRGRPLPSGAYVTLDLDYGAQWIALAFTEGKRTILKNTPLPNTTQWTPQSTYHIFLAKSDGSEIRELTDGIWNDFDPCFLPNGRIAFISERRGGHDRCSQRPNPVFTLHDMARDGSDLSTLSYHETNEWNPSVGHDGMLLYTRWDYVDRAPNIAHHLWTAYPDGRDPRSLHGNYPGLIPNRTIAELAIRAIPGSPKMMAVAGPHHGQAYGALIMIDMRTPDDNAMSQVRRITPEVPFPESEVARRSYVRQTPFPKATAFGNGEAFGTPWPLSEDFYLAVYDSGRKRYGIYLVDAFGNRELLYRDPAIACLDPIPLRPRTRPPEIPSPVQRTYAGHPDQRNRGTGRVAIMNIYQSDFEWPKDTKISAVRVIQLFPRLTHPQQNPNIGAARQTLARGVLGTAPVEADGSAYFEVPAGKPIYFQALDQNGLAVQSMRSATYVHANEQLSCIGCHEDKWKQDTRSPKANTPQALRRPVSKLTPGPDGSYPVLFPRLVQPVLDAKCVACHQKEPKACGLRGTVREGTFPDDREIARGTKGADWGWSEAMCSLVPYGNYQGGRANTISLPYDRGGGSRSIPGKVGARGAKLYEMLKAGHHDVELTDDQWCRITTWLDTNCLFYGAYRDEARQQQGEIVLPLLE